MPRSKQEVTTGLSRELTGIADPLVRAALSAVLTDPRQETRRASWLPSKPSHTCWIVADLGERDVGIAFCEDYPRSHSLQWGLVFLTDDDLGDSNNWYPSLEMLYRDYRPWPTRAHD